MKQLLVLALLSLLNMNTWAEKDPLDYDNFDFPEPRATDLQKKELLWGTYYYLPELKNSNGAYPLYDMKSQELGPRLTHREWCDSAMEGSVRVSFDNGEVHVYNYAGVTGDKPVDCKKYFKHDVSRTKFRMANGPWGDGVDDFILSPARTVATDPKIIPHGTVLYIPAARGAEIVMPNGRKIIHDGYFFAGDKGGAIKGTHIDVYIGTFKKAPFFPWIKSKESGTFDAYRVKDQSVIDRLTELHLLR